MAPATTQNDEWDLPKLKAAIGFEVRRRLLLLRGTWIRTYTRSQDDAQAAAVHNKDTGTPSPPGPWSYAPSPDVVLIMILQNSST